MLILKKTENYTFLNIRLILMGMFLIFLSLLPMSAYTAISYIDSSSCTATANNGADATLTFPSTLPGDLVIIGHQIPDDDSDHDLTLSDMTGWTEVDDLFANETGDDAQLAVYWKIMGETPDTEAILVGAGIVSETDTDTSGVCMVFRGVDPVTPMDVTPTTDTGLNTMHPNPPSINHNNPSGVWTVIVGSNADTLGTTGSYTFPTGYTTDTVEDRASDSTDGTIGISYNSSPSDPEDPGVMTHSGTDSTVRSWAAVTMALRPLAIITPTVSTDFTSNIQETSATLKGAKTGGGDAVQHGFVYSVDSDLITDVSTTTLGSKTSNTTFSSNINSLTSDQTYFYRAYATNTAGIAYGITRSFYTGNSSITRAIRLFEGFIIKLFTGKIVLFGR